MAFSDINLGGCRNAVGAKEPGRGGAMSGGAECQPLLNTMEPGAVKGDVDVRAAFFASQMEARTAHSRDHVRMLAARPEINASLEAEA